MQASTAVCAALFERRDSGRGQHIDRDTLVPGESEGEFADTSFLSNVDDVVAAAEFLGETQGAPSVLIGHSLGGSMCLLYALIYCEDY